MTNIEVLLKRWRSAGVLEGDATARIRAWEAEQTPSAGLRWQGVVALILGALLLATGVILFVSAHWDQIGPGARFALVLGMVAAVHLAGGMVREGIQGCPAPCMPWEPSLPAPPSRLSGRSSTSKNTGPPPCCCGRLRRSQGGRCCTIRPSRR